MINLGLCNKQHWYQFLVVFQTLQSCIFYDICKISQTPPPFADWYIFDTLYGKYPVQDCLYYFNEINTLGCILFGLSFINYKVNIINVKNSLDLDFNYA